MSAVRTPPTAGRLRILVVMRHGGYVRNYDSVLRELAERGHDLTVAFEAPKAKLLGETGALLELIAEHPHVRQIVLPSLKGSRPHRRARGLRLALDYLRYLGPRFRDAAALRARAREMVPAPLRLAERLPGTLPARGLAWGLRVAERRSAVPAPLVEVLRKRRPDVVLVTPLVQFGGMQTDVLRAAKALGLPTGLLVASWDNLTNKGLIHELPDRVVVWNESQATEATQLHGVPAERVVVTGANSYDHWFAWSARDDRATFLARVGLPERRPLLLYLSSSPFIAPDEVPFVRRWLAALREAPDPQLRAAAVLVRPHPLAGRRWRDADLSGCGAVAIWPPEGANPADHDSRAELFDSIFHAAAVIGLNTSAQIESAIVDRPVLTVLDPEFAGTQQGTLHFHYLPRENGGPLLVAGSLDEHLEQLAAALAVNDHTAANRRFLEHFVRPHGLASPATPRVVRAIEQLGGLDALALAPLGG